MSDLIVVTASAGSFPGFTAALRNLPVTVEERPLIRFAPPSDWGPVDSVISRVGEYGALVFTSPRAAEYFVLRIKQGRANWPAVQPPAVWASGPQTGAALHGALGSVRLPLGQHRGQIGAAKALARAMLEEKVTGPILFLCGEAHREELPAELRAHGITVDEIVCYRSVLAGESEARVAASRASVLLVASPRVADLLLRVCPRGSRPALLAVGPTTAESARSAGWSPAAVATEPTARALAAAVRSLLAKKNR